jgi:hypothetical protein
VQVGYVPTCEAIQIEAYKPSTSNLRLAHNQMCPNLATFIPDTDGRVRTRSFSTLLQISLLCKISSRCTHCFVFRAYLVMALVAVTTALLCLQRCALLLSTSLHHPDVLHVAIVLPLVLLPFPSVWRTPMLSCVGSPAMPERSSFHAISVPTFQCRSNGTHVTSIECAGQHGQRGLDERKL